MMTIDYSIETQEKFNELLENSYHDEDMHVFINEYGEENFIRYYEDYVSFGESYTYQVIDEFIYEFGLENIRSFNDAYMGQWDSFRHFVENIFLEINNVPEEVAMYLDWNKIEDDYAYDYYFEYNTNTVYNKNF